MSDRLIALEKHLRNAVARRRYAEVRRFAAQFGTLAAEEWRALPPGHAAARRIFEQYQETMEWARLMVCLSRASVVAELRRVRLTDRYLRPETGSIGRLRLDI